MQKLREHRVLLVHIYNSTLRFETITDTQQKVSSTNGAAVYIFFFEVPAGNFFRDNITGAVNVALPELHFVDNFS